MINPERGEAMVGDVKIRVTFNDLRVIQKESGSSGLRDVIDRCANMDLDMIGIILDHFKIDPETCGCSTSELITQMVGAISASLFGDELPPTPPGETTETTGQNGET